MQVASFVKRIVKDCEGYEQSPNYAERVVKSIIANRNRLPKCLRDKPEFEAISEVLNEILTLPINEVETLVKAHTSFR